MSLSPVSIPIKTLADLEKDKLDLTSSPYKETSQKVYAWGINQKCELSLKEKSGPKVDPENFDNKIFQENEPSLVQGLNRKVRQVISAEEYSVALLEDGG
jgi:alpha-tubulin suppressor-like RCC1 family protein